MSPKNTPKRQRRVYRSPMRDERTIQTRERILDALVQVLARNGIAELSIPLVAREAKVSIPSVYRYFPTKRDLFAALDDYAHTKGSFSFSEFPRSETPEELAAMIPEMFQRRESIEPTIAAALRTRIGYDIRRPQLDERAKYFETALLPATKRLSNKEQDWLRDVVFVLTSYGCVRAFKDYLGLDTHGAAERVAWAVRVLARGAQSPEDGEPK